MVDAPAALDIGVRILFTITRSEQRGLTLIPVRLLQEWRALSLSCIKQRSRLEVRRTSLNGKVGRLPNNPPLDPADGSGESVRARVAPSCSEVQNGRCARARSGMMSFPRRHDAPTCGRQTCVETLTKDPTQCTRSEPMVAFTGPSTVKHLIVSRSEVAKVSRYSQVHPTVLNCWDGS